MLHVYIIYLSLPWNAFIVLEVTIIIYGPSPSLKSFSVIVLALSSHNESFSSLSLMVHYNVQ